MCTAAWKEQTFLLGKQQEDPAGRTLAYPGFPFMIEVELAQNWLEDKQFPGDRRS